jgi:hypothetical protein
MANTMDLSKLLSPKVANCFSKKKFSSTNKSVLRIDKKFHIKLKLELYMDMEFNN